MKTRLTIAAIVAAAGAAAPATAQDSISKQAMTFIVFADSVSPFDNAEQLNAYVVDLSPLVTSWGNTFGIAPIAKLSKSETAFTTAPAQTSAISSTEVLVDVLPYPQYAFWNEAGRGVNNNPMINDPPQGFINAAEVSPSRQLAYAVQETYFSPSPRYEAIVGGFINYSPSDPTRLYVSRLNVASGSTGPGPGTSNGEAALGAVDASGFVNARSESFDADPTPDRLTGVDLWRFDMLDRTAGVRNFIGESGASDTGDRIANNLANDQSPPNMVPRNVHGTRPVMFSAGFNGTVGYEQTPPPSPVYLFDTTNYRPGAADSRGGAGYVSANFFGSPGTASGTGAVLSKRTTAGLVRSLSIWGIGATGQPQAGNAITIDLPALVADPTTGFDNTQYSGPLADDEFGHFWSQTFFSAGPQVAMRVEPGTGKLLIAAPVAARSALFTSNSDKAINPRIYLAVARLDSPTDTDIEWVMAAYNGSASFSGKPVLDGTGATIGTLGGYDELATNPASLPGLSAATMDAGGNLWFLGVYKPADGGSVERALFRAVYDAASFSYDIELVIREDFTQVFGLNSDRNYLVNFLAINDSNSVDDDTIWGKSATEGTANGASLAGVGDPAALGGLVLTASIVYDANNDGDFIPLTGGAGDPNSFDQNYNVVLFLSGAPFGGPGGDGACCLFVQGCPDDCFIASEGDCTAAGGTFQGAGSDCSSCTEFNPCDWNGDGSINTGDFFEFFAAFFGTPPDADYNGDGGTNTADFFGFFGCFFATPPGSSTNCP